MNDNINKKYAKLESIADNNKRSRLMRIISRTGSAIIIGAGIYAAYKGINGISEQVAYAKNINYSPLADLFLIGGGITAANIGVEELKDNLNLC